MRSPEELIVELRDAVATRLSGGDRDFALSLIDWWERHGMLTERQLRAARRLVAGPQKEERALVWSGVRKKRYSWDETSALYERLLHKRAEFKGGDFSRVQTLLKCYDEKRFWTQHQADEVNDLLKMLPKRLERDAEAQQNAKPYIATPEKAPRNLNSEYSLDFFALVKKFSTQAAHQARDLRSDKGADKPALTLEEVIAKNRLRTSDRRSKGGALWVFGADGNEDVAKELRALGFREASRGGWWRK